MSKRRILSWFRRQDYDVIRGLVADDPNLPNPFDEWSEAATKELEKLESLGIVVRKAIINPREFSAWCQASGMDHNWATLGAFAIIIDRKYYERGA